VGPLADFVQVVLQGIELSFNLREGYSLRGDDQARILARNISQKGDPD
jgi:hypothetical protein